MINIKIIKKNNIILGFESTGHSGYAESGSDIVCSAVSSLLGNCYVACLQIKNLDFKFVQNENIPLFSLMVNQINENLQFLFQTTIISLQDIAKQYKKYVKIEIKGEKNEIN